MKKLYLSIFIVLKKMFAGQLGGCVGCYRLTSLNPTCSASRHAPSTTCCSLRFVSYGWKFCSLKIEVIFASFFCDFYENDSFCRTLKIYKDLTVLSAFILKNNVENLTNMCRNWLWLTILQWWNWTKRPKKRVKYCDVRAVSHSCDVFKVQVYKNVRW